MSRTIKFTLRLALKIALVGIAVFIPAPLYAQQLPDLVPGAVFRDCEQCPEMTVIPAGRFIMGLGGKTKREGPPHEVVIPRPFAMGRYEVTFDQWQACLDAGGCSHNPDDHDWGRGNRPVVNVDYYKVQEYIAWLRQLTGQAYYLPGEAEWEYAHRAGTETAFPWGDDVGENRANCKDCKSPWGASGTAPVGSFQPNKFGLYDTVANVFEWIADCWNPTHDGAPSTATVRTEGDCNQRIIRGGSFYYFKKVSRASYRSKNPMNVKSYWLGFRVARQVP